MTRKEKKYLDRWLAAYETFRRSEEYEVFKKESEKRELPPKTNIAWVCIYDKGLANKTCLININQIAWMDANSNTIVMSNGDVFNVNDESMAKVLRIIGGQP